MKIVLITVSVILGFAQSMPKSCLRKRAAIGETDGEFRSDYKILSNKATRDMRLAQINYCVDGDRKLKAI